MGIQHILSSFSDETTVHGLPKAIKSRSRSGRCFWICACLLAISVCAGQFVQLLNKYYSYPKKVNIEVVTSHVPFPSVSLCNMRNLDTTVLNEMNRIFNSFSGNDSKMIWNDNTSEFINAYMKLLSKYYPMFRNHKDIPTHIFQGVLSRTTIATNIKDSLVRSSGISFDEFIVSCLYGGNECSARGEFESFFDPYYYNCYTYNARELGDGDSMLAEGLENGWSAVVLTGSGMLDTNEDVRMIPGTHELHSPQASNEGVRVVLHPPHSHPFPHTEGFDVPPGHSVSFGLRPHETMRIGPPHGNCTGASDPASGYRLIECQKNCVQKGVVKYCGCKSINLPDNNEVPRHIRYCSDDHDIPQYCADNVTSECVRELYAFFNRMKCAREESVRLSKNATLARECGCFPPCYELGYDVTYSLSKWPAHSFDGEEAYIDIFTNLRYLSRFNNSEDYLKFIRYSDYFAEPNRHTSMKDFARLNVYIADSNVIRTIETEDYQTSQLLSDIGGQFGLWIGISVISLSELFELIIDIFSYVTKRHILRRDRRTKDKQKKNESGHNGFAYSSGYDTVSPIQSPCENRLNQQNSNNDVLHHRYGEALRHKPQYYPYRQTEMQQYAAPLLIMAAPPTPEMA